MHSDLMTFNRAPIACCGPSGKMRGRLRHCAVGVAAVLACVAVSPARAQPRCAYTIRYDPADAPARLEVTLDASGLAPTEASWSLVLDGWGGWPDLDRPYIEITRSEPPLGSPRGVTFPILIPTGWDGSIRVAYTIPLLEIGSADQQSHSILPAAADSYLLAAVANTVARLDVDGVPAGGARTITIEAPEGWTVFTGWAGGSPGRQESTLPAAGENAIFAIGRPIDVRAADAGGVRCEVFQFTDGDAAAAKVLDIARSLVAHVTNELGHGPPEPLRICISGTTGGGFLTDHGLVVGLPPGSPGWLIDSPYFRHLVCHELYHTWLGHMLREADSERTVWFKEGFTDYLSLWHAAACGVVSRSWFAERMFEIESDAKNSSFGAVSFADPAVEWRDGDGPLETMAYKGGAVLAFAMDAQLRSSGRGGLPALLRGMIDSGEVRYSAETIRARLRSMGLDDFDRRYVSGRETPSVRDALGSLGYQQRELPTELAYIGVRVEPDAGFGRVAEIDPEGPAAAAGFRIGDVIGGFAPGRGEEVTLGESVTTRFAFGLARIAPSEGAVSVWVHRGGGEVAELKVVPRLIPGGHLTELVLTPEAEAILFGGE